MCIDAWIACMCVSVELTQRVTHGNGTMISCGRDGKTSKPFRPLSKVRQAQPMCKHAVCTHAWTLHCVVADVVAEEGAGVSNTGECRCARVVCAAD